MRLRIQIPRHWGSSRARCEGAGLVTGNPGEYYPRPATLAHARAHQELNAFPWPIAVDDIDGTLHRALRANDKRVLREGLRALAAGRPLPIGERELRVVPALKAVGVMRGVLERAGADAVRDVRRELPGLYPLLGLEALFRPLPPLGRGIAAVTTAGFGLLAMLGGVAGFLTRRS